MKKPKKRWGYSPDQYQPDGGPDAPKRLAYQSSPENYNASETPQKAGASRGSIQQADGTDNKRANYRSKSARVPEPGAGGTKWGGVESYNDTKEL